jgi:signal transduction histidine kinase
VSPDDFLAWADALPEPTLLTSTAGQVLAANRAVERRLEVPRAGLLDRPLAEVVTDPPDRVADYLRACARSRELVLGALTLARDGRPLSCRCEGAVLRPTRTTDPPQLLLRLLPRQCAVAEFVALSNKVDALAREVARRRQAERALQEQDRRKDEFIATLAHELRNPLAPITTSLYILRLPDVPAEKDARAREVIERQVGVMNHLVTALLDVSRLMRNKLALDRRRIDLATVVQHGVETARPLVEAHRHHLGIALPAGRVVLEGDPLRLAQVVAQLLSNAAKFTDPGGHISVSAAVTDPQPETRTPEVELRVQDDGIGIPAESLSRIFDTFFHEERAPTRNAGGLGIGLTLVKRLVEMHGGTVAAESEGPGKGSTFTVRLPAAEVGG